MRAVLITTILAVLAVPAGASAAVTCSYDSSATPKRLVVALSADGDAAAVTIDGGAIHVNGGLCLDGAAASATLHNVDTIVVDDSSSDGSTELSIADVGAYLPGDTPELFALQSEIEWDIDLGGGEDSLVVAGGVGHDFISLGTDGLNASPAHEDADADLGFAGVESLRLLGLGGPDWLHAGGLRGTGARFDLPLEIDGGDGHDQLVGGTASDKLLGGLDDDALHPGPGDDEVDGGDGGLDQAGYTDASGGVTVDMGAPNPHDTGPGGVDTLTSVEGLIGSQHADRLALGADGGSLHGYFGDDLLAGGAGTDVLDGSFGDDRIDPGAGDDTVHGGEGVDTLSFASAAGPVSAKLGVEGPQNTSATGTKLIAEFENLEGGPFADSLWGDSGANVIAGGAGADVVRAFAGADRALVRDGEADGVRCGDGADSVEADAAGTDAADSDCEAVERPAAPPADTVIALRLAAKPLQRRVAARGVAVSATCPDEPCDATVRAKGGRKPVALKLTAGQPRELRIRLTKKRARAVRAALRRGKRPRVRVTVNATDAAGNAATERVTIEAR
jgi:Ca2+-binding RTX toxin-like protein